MICEAVMSALMELTTNSFCVYIRIVFIFKYCDNLIIILTIKIKLMIIIMINIIVCAWVCDN